MQIILILSGIKLLRGGDLCSAWSTCHSCLVLEPILWEVSTKSSSVHQGYSRLTSSESNFYFPASWNSPYLCLDCQPLLVICLQYNPPLVLLWSFICHEWQNKSYRSTRFTSPYFPFLLSVGLSPDCLCSYLRLSNRYFCAFCEGFF